MVQVQEWYRCGTGTHLPRGGVGVDGDLAGSSSMAVHRGGHLLPRQQGGNLLLRGDVLPRFGLLQRISDKEGELLDLSPGKLLSDPGQSHAGRINRGGTEQNTNRTLTSGPSAMLSLQNRTQTEP